MTIQKVFSVACVTDLEKSIRWYAALIGREADDRPMDGLAQWHIGENAGLQLVLDIEKSGTSLITMIIPSMNEARERLGESGIQLEPDIRGDFGIIAQISDPDGNRVTFAEPPEKAARG